MKLAYSLHCYLLVILFCSNFAPLFAQQSAESNPWTEVANSNGVSLENAPVKPAEFKAYRLDTRNLHQQLSNQTSSFSISIPLGNTTETVVLQEKSVMQPGLASRFPEIRTFTGYLPSSVATTVKADLTPNGFHAMIISPEKTVFIDPIQVNDERVYLVYDKDQLQPSAEDFFAETDPISPPAIEFVPGNQTVQNSETGGNSQVTEDSDGNLRTYRMAIAATGEYTIYHGGSISNSLSAIATTLNRVNGVMERELSVSFVLVNDNDKVIFQTSSADPFTNNNPALLVNESQSILDALIGSANYDIGHTFGTGPGGLAALGVACFNGYKGQGFTGSSTPVGDAFDIDLFAHELSHQLGAHHTFNGNMGSCAGNRHAPTAFEPGSGSTIMSYAGICGSQNIQLNSNDYFHAASLGEIFAFTVTGIGNTCPTITSQNNNPPVANAGSDYTIPRNTPFELEGTGNDPDGGALTYNWEQYDLGMAGTLDDPSAADGPVFRSFAPQTTPKRIFPQLNDILTQTSTTGEVLPGVGRTLNFLFTVRDNHPGGGRVAVDTASITVDGQSGPFRVLGGNTPAVWAGGSSQTITWDVAGTNNGNVACSRVNISLSVDGGQTFSHALGQFDNTGSATVQIPNLNTTQARIKIKAEGNVFFDISDADLEIQETTTEPRVDNPTFTAVGMTSAQMGAEVVSEGGATVTQRGVLWSLQPAPVIGGNGVVKVADTGTGAGVFSVQVSDLPPGTEIFFRGFATNSLGTGYSEVDTFLTDRPTATVSLTQNLVTVSEDETSGTDCHRIYELLVPLTLSEALNEPLMVEMEFKSGDALQYADWVLPGGNQVVFPAGFTGSQNLIVHILDDTEAEVQESASFELKISDLTLAWPGKKTKLDVSIQDNDVSPVAAGISSDQGISASNHLGGFGKVHFYHEITGNLMLTLENLTAHDYGCVWVENDRVGTSASPFWDNSGTREFDLMDKTWMLYAENNQSAGQFRATLYFTETEVDGWANTTGNSVQQMNELDIVLSPGFMNAISPSSREPDGPVFIQRADSVDKFGTGYMVTAVLSGPMGGLGAGKTGVLPQRVNWIDFFGEYTDDEIVMLTWITGGEQHVSHYIVERLDKGGVITEISDAIPAVSAGISQQTYQQTDSLPTEPYADYRIKVVFDNDSVSYSDLIRVETAYPIVNTYPNPFRENLKFYVEGEGEATLTITSPTSGILYREVWDNSENNLIEVNLGKLPAGIYFYSVNNRGRRVGGMVIKYDD